MRTSHGVNGINLIMFYLLIMLRPYNNHMAPYGQEPLPEPGSAVQCYAACFSVTKHFSFA